MKKIIFLINFICVNNTINSVEPLSVEIDDAYQSYVQRCKRNVSAIRENIYNNQIISIKDVADIIAQYCSEPITYEQWQKNNEILIDAANQGNFDRVETLLKSGEVDPNARNERDSTVLMMAAHKKNKEIVRTLLNFTNININAQNNYGHTALIFAVSNNAKSVRDKEIIQMLLNHSNIDVNAQNNNGDTALILAVEEFAHREILEILLDHPNIEINISNHQNETALSIALNKKQEKFVQLIRQKLNQKKMLKNDRIIKENFNA